MKESSMSKKEISFKVQGEVILDIEEGVGDSFMYPPFVATMNLIDEGNHEAAFARLTLKDLSQLIEALTELKTELTGKLKDAIK